jgi:hypothetical protein
MIKTTFATQKMHNNNNNNNIAKYKNGLVTLLAWLLFSDPIETICDSGLMWLVGNDEV